MYMSNEEFEKLKKELREYVENTPKQFIKCGYAALIPASRNDEFVEYVVGLSKSMGISVYVYPPIPYDDEYKVEVEFDFRSPEERNR